MDKETPPFSLAISIGDPAGIGPEILIRGIQQLIEKNEDITPLVVSPQKCLIKAAERFQMNPDSFIWIKGNEVSLELLSSIIDENKIPALAVNPDPVELLFAGRKEKEAGAAGFACFEKALNLTVLGKTDALLTLPLNKDAVCMAGIDFHGHTDLCAKACGTAEPLMILCDELSKPCLRVALLTTHCALKEVPFLLNNELIFEKAKVFFETLQTDFSIQRPKIALLGVNPHAGEGGRMGREEIDIMKLGIQRLEKNEMTIQGPFPADGFFGSGHFKNFDGILAPYHDVGLVPFKLLSMTRGVNFSAGIRIIRSSVDHGTAFDIAGKGIADIESFLQAGSLAARIHQNRKRKQIK